MYHIVFKTFHSVKKIIWEPPNFVFHRRENFDLLVTQNEKSEMLLPAAPPQGIVTPPKPDPNPIHWVQRGGPGPPIWLCSEHYLKSLETLAILIFIVNTC